MTDFELPRDVVVVGRVRDDGHVPEVLRGGPDKGGPPDIDVLDQLVERRPLAGRRCLERVEVDHDHVDRIDPVLLQGPCVLGIGAHGQDAARDARVKGLHAPVQHLREPGHAGHVQHLQAGLSQGPCSPARGNERDAATGQPAGEVRQARLVGNAQEHASDSCHKRPF